MKSWTQFWVIWSTSIYTLGVFGYQQKKLYDSALLLLCSNLGKETLFLINEVKEKLGESWKFVLLSVITDY